MRRRPKLRHSLSCNVRQFGMLLKMYNLLEIDPTLIQVIRVGRYSLVCFEKPLTIESIHLRSLLLLLLLLVCLCRLFDWAAPPDALILYSVAEVLDSGLILDAKLSKHRRFSISALSLDSLVCFVMLCVIHSRIELEMIHHPSRAQLSWPFSLTLSSGLLLSKCIPRRLRPPL